MAITTATYAKGKQRLFELCVWYKWKYATQRNLTETTYIQHSIKIGEVCSILTRFALISLQVK